MSDTTKDRLAKLIGPPFSERVAYDLADKLLAAGVTLPEPAPEPEWIATGSAVGHWNVWHNGNLDAVFHGRSDVEAETKAREYVARKNAKPLDVDALARAAYEARYPVASSWATTCRAERALWVAAVLRVLELAQVGTVERPLPPRDEVARVMYECGGSTWESAHPLAVRDWLKQADAVLALLNERAK